VGTVNIGSRAPTCLTFYCGAAREGLTAIHDRRPRSGHVSDQKTDLKIRPRDHIPNTRTSIPKQNLGRIAAAPKVRPVRACTKMLLEKTNPRGRKTTEPSISIIHYTRVLYTHSAGPRLLFKGSQNVSCQSPRRQGAAFSLRCAGPDPCYVTGGRWRPRGNYVAAQLSRSFLAVYRFPDEPSTDDRATVFTVHQDRASVNKLLIDRHGITTTTTTAEATGHPNNYASALTFNFA
jgi:hypothetical protein